MKLKHKVALMATTVGLATATLVPAFASAQTVNADSSSHFSALIQALVQRFNLSQTDVEKFFQEQQVQRPMGPRANAASTAQVQAHIEQRLTAAVTSGKITETQKTAILAKTKEAKAKHEEARKLSREESKKMMDAYRVEVEAWLTAQGLGHRYLRLIMGPKPMGGSGIIGPDRSQNSQGGQNGQQGQGFGPRGFGQSPMGGKFGGPMDAQD